MNFLSKLHQFGYRPTFIIGTILLGIVLHSCCEDSKEIYNLPEESGRYYENIDTIVFYCEETDEYETYIKCNQILDYLDDEISDGRCSYWEYFEVKYFSFYRDSCNSDYELYISYLKHTGKWTYKIHMRYPTNSDWETVTWGEESTRNQEILGYFYENITYSDFSNNDSVKSAVFSIEYGMVQYTINDLTFSLLRTEN